MLEHVGVQEVGEKTADAPVGSPDEVRETDCEVPETKVAVMVFVTDWPWVTDLLPPLDTEKTKAALTVRLNVVV